MHPQRDRKYWFNKRGLKGKGWRVPPLFHAGSLARLVLRGVFRFLFAAAQS